MSTFRLPVTARHHRPPLPKEEVQNLVETGLLVPSQTFCPMGPGIRGLPVLRGRGGVGRGPERSHTTETFGVGPGTSLLSFQRSPSLGPPLLSTPRSGPSPPVPFLNLPGPGPEGDSVRSGVLPYGSGTSGPTSLPPGRPKPRPKLDSVGTRSDPDRSDF